MLGGESERLGHDSRMSNGGSSQGTSRGSRPLGQSAVQQIKRIATGWRLRAIADPILICTHAQTPEAIFAPKLIPAQDLTRCEELGSALAAGLTPGIF